MKYKLKNVNFFVEIENDVIKSIKKEFNSSTEIGGWLFGVHSDETSTTYIKSILFAPNISTRPDINFEFDEIEYKIIDEKVAFGEYLVGGFHTHPQGSPIPSWPDHNQMSEFSWKYMWRYPEILSLIMGKKYSMKLWYYKKHDIFEFEKFD